MQKNQPQSDTMRLKVPLPGIFPPFSYQTKVLGLGSCFVESVGKQMQRLKLPVQLNPMGVQYNPLALARVLQYGLGALDWSADE
ncbi:MAG: GSCFA domain-containing protein, partial [Mameliella sp.]|nr:GSCFA domain-containing protein [Phaeodactylibacter sp.]